MSDFQEAMRRLETLPASPVVEQPKRIIEYKSRIRWTEFKRSYRHVVWYSQEITNIVIRYLIWKQMPKVTADGMPVEITQVGK